MPETYHLERQVFIKSSNRNSLLEKKRGGGKTVPYLPCTAFYIEREPSNDLLLLIFLSLPAHRTTVDSARKDRIMNPGKAKEENNFLMFYSFTILQLCNFQVRFTTTGKNNADF